MCTCYDGDWLDACLLQPVATAPPASTCCSLQSHPTTSSLEWHSTARPSSHTARPIPGHLMQAGSEVLFWDLRLAMQGVESASLQVMGLNWEHLLMACYPPSKKHSSTWKEKWSPCRERSTDQKQWSNSWVHWWLSCSFRGWAKVPFLGCLEDTHTYMRNMSMWKVSFKQCIE